MLTLHLPPLRGHREPRRESWPRTFHCSQCKSVGQPHPATHRSRERMFFIPIQSAPDNLSVRSPSTTPAAKLTSYILDPTTPAQTRAYPRGNLVTAPTNFRMDNAMPNPMFSHVHLISQSTPMSSPSRCSTPVSMYGGMTPTRASPVRFSGPLSTWSIPSDDSSKFRQLPCKTFISVGACPYRDRCIYTFTFFDDP